MRTEASQVENFTAIFASTRLVRIQILRAILPHFCVIFSFDRRRPALYVWFPSLSMRTLWAGRSIRKCAIVSQRGPSITTTDFRTQLVKKIDAPTSNRSSLDTERAVVRYTSISSISSTIHSFTHSFNDCGDTSGGKRFSSLTAHTCRHTRHSLSSLFLPPLSLSLSLASTHTHTLHSLSPPRPYIISSHILSSTHFFSLSLSLTQHTHTHSLSLCVLHTLSV